MNYMFIDEKGPQETIKISHPYDSVNKIKLGDDKMQDYIASVINVDGSRLDVLDKDYKILEESYKKERRFLDNNKELKGKDIFGKKLRFGISGMRKREIDFSDKLIDILIENQVRSSLFIVNKISIIADIRFNDWLFSLEKIKLLDSHTKQFSLNSIWNVKYTLIKYLKNEANESVVHSMFNFNKSNKSVIYEILNDLKLFIENNSSIKRMKKQIQAYKDLVTIIKKSKHMIQDSLLTERKVKFDWEKVSFNLDLWMSEMSIINDFKKENTVFFLDEGIPDTPFEHLELKKIEKNQVSSDHVGLRICDVLVVLIGKMVSEFSIDTDYDKNKPEERKLLSEEWFDLDESQFKLIQKLNLFLFPSNSQFCIINDTFFDISVVLEAYFKYIGYYKNFFDYNAHIKDHVENHFKSVYTIANEKWSASIDIEKKIKLIFGSMENAVTSKFIKPF